MLRNLEMNLEEIEGARWKEAQPPTVGEVRRTWVHTETQPKVAGAVRRKLNVVQNPPELVPAASSMELQHRRVAAGSAWFDDGCGHGSSIGGKTCKMKLSVSTIIILHIFICKQESHSYF